LAAQIGLTRILEREGDLPAALAACRAAAELAPEDPGYRRWEASLLRRLKRLPEAERTLADALTLAVAYPELGPERGRILLEYAWLRLDQGQPARAREFYDRARKAGSPAVPELEQALAAAGA